MKFERRRFSGYFEDKLRQVIIVDEINDRKFTLPRVNNVGSYATEGYLDFRSNKPNVIVSQRLSMGGKKRKTLLTLTGFFSVFRNVDPEVMKRTFFMLD